MGNHFCLSSPIYKPETFDCFWQHSWLAAGHLGTSGWSVLACTQVINDFFSGGLIFHLCCMVISTELLFTGCSLPSEGSATEIGAADRNCPNRDVRAVLGTCMTKKSEPETEAEEKTAKKGGLFATFSYFSGALFVIRGFFFKKGGLGWVHWLLFEKEGERVMPWSSQRWGNLQPSLGHKWSEETLFPLFSRVCSCFKWCHQLRFFGWLVISRGVGGRIVLCMHITFSQLARSSCFPAPCWSCTRKKRLGRLKCNFK